jgi:MFS family permease
LPPLYKTTKCHLPEHLMPENFSKNSIRPLNWLNFFAADVSDGVGPFLAVYLATNLHWKSGQIGMAIAATTFSMVLMQSPAGYVVDNIQRKRMPIIVASIIVAALAFTFPLLRSFYVIMACQVVLGLAASFYIPTLVALASVVAPQGKFDAVISKNQSFNHAGNVASAVLTGVVAKFTHNNGIFYCMMGLAVMCTISGFSIPQKDVNQQTPNKEVDKESKKGLLKELLGNRAFLIFLLLTVIFYFSNGAMLPLVAQEIAKDNEKNSTLYLSACIIIAQLVMVPTVYVCGKQAQNGRKKLLIIAFILLAIRGILYTFTDVTWHLLIFQVLDGMAAGVFSVVSLMVVDDLMGNSGRASFAQGLWATGLSLGSTLSNLSAGFMVDAAGFKIGFMFLSALALGALFLLWKFMPETLHKLEKQPVG